MKLPPDMVLFDCDGVLVDSECIASEVLCRNLLQYGLTVTAAQFADMFLGGTIAGVEKGASAMGARLPANWVDEAYAEIFDALAAEVEAIPGVFQVLDHLDRAGIPYAVCSNGPHRKMQITMGRTGLTSRFEGRIYSREDVQAPKPAPDIYLKAAAAAGVGASGCVVVEDSVSGARAGQAAGMLVFGYAAETPEEKLAPHCDQTFDDMARLPELLRL